MSVLSISLLRAIEFAAEKHKQQKRKGKNQTPYINHPIQVAHLLAEFGQEENSALLMAAILHDTIEDTATTQDELAATFGQQVAQIVLEVTDDKSLPVLERKRLQVVQTPKKSVEAKMLKIADKTCNVKDITADPPANWSLARKIAYLDWAEAVVKGAVGVNRALEQHFFEVLQQGRIQLGCKKTAISVI